MQHPTGGIIGVLNVRDGGNVAAGDLLSRLDDTQTRANLAIVTKRLDELSARRSRLEAERDGRDEIAFPNDLTGRIGDPVVASLIGGETRLFDLRRNARAGQMLGG